jgi:hypothetical protein
MSPSLPHLEMSAFFVFVLLSASYGCFLEKSRFRMPQERRSLSRSTYGSCLIRVGLARSAAQQDTCQPTGSRPMNWRNFDLHFAPEIFEGTQDIS